MILQTNHLHLLNNSDNYKKNIVSSFGEIVDKYMKLLIEYIHFTMEHINNNTVTIKNNEYNKFIFGKGMDTITHVFTLLLYYSKNVELAYYHSQKAFYFYIEFISQISDDQNTFLNLSSRDAVMFVYKKTIFNIQGDIQKYNSHGSKDDMDKLTTLDCIISIFKHIINFTLHNLNPLEKIQEMGNLESQLETTCAKLLKYTFTLQEYDIIEVFISSIQDKNISNKTYNYLIDLFIQKYSRIKPDVLQQITSSRIKEKCIDLKGDEKLKESPDFFIKFIFQK